VVHPLDSPALVRAQDCRHVRRGGGRSQNLLAPGLHLWRERELKARIIEERADLLAVLLTLGNLGGGYDEAVELISRADRARVVTSAVVVDAISPELNIQQLAQFAAVDPALVKANLEVVRAGTVHPGVDANGFDLPSPEPDPATVVAPPPPRVPLNREPGRLFKRHDPSVIDPNAVPAGGGQ
jgi:hypothetical protein